MKEPRANDPAWREILWIVALLLIAFADVVLVMYVPPLFGR